MIRLIVTYRSILLFASILIASIAIQSCKDQPIDDGSQGTATIDTTVVVVRDTILVSNTDTIVETRIDTIIVERLDTLVVEVIIRDTIRSSRVDTIVVKEDSELVRIGQLRFRGYPQNSPVGAERQSITVPISDWIQYKVADSAGKVVGIGLSLSARMPSQIQAALISSEGFSPDYHLLGVNMFIPIFRIGDAGVNSRKILLSHHPYQFQGPTPGGGIALNVGTEEPRGSQSLWSGQIVEVDRPNGTDEYINQGSLEIVEIDYSARTVHVEIEARFYLRYQIRDYQVAEPFDVTISSVLGY